VIGTGVRENETMKRLWELIKDDPIAQALVEGVLLGTTGHWGDRHNQGATSQEDYLISLVKDYRARGGSRLKALVTQSN
jgi:hypothetical protein